MQGLYKRWVGKFTTDELMVNFLILARVSYKNHP